METTHSKRILPDANGVRDADSPAGRKQALGAKAKDLAAPTWKSAVRYGSCKRGGVDATCSHDAVG